MPQITAIVPQKRDKNRCNIEVDGRFLCGLSLMTVMQYRLKPGMETDMEFLSHVQFESERETAYDRALTHLSLSMKTEGEMRDFLKRKGYVEEVADYVVARLRGNGLLDDEAYAQAYAMEMGKRKGEKRIVLELRRKGVAEEQIAAAVEGLDETDAAKRVLEKYVRGKDLSDRKTLQKAYSYLLSKGFGYETARSALLSLGADEGEEG